MGPQASGGSTSGERRALLNALADEVRVKNLATAGTRRPTYYKGGSSGMTEAEKSPSVVGFEGVCFNLPSSPVALRLKKNRRASHQLRKIGNQVLSTLNESLNIQYSIFTF